MIERENAFLASLRRPSTPPRPSTSFSPPSSSFKFSFVAPPPPPSPSQPHPTPPGLTFSEGGSSVVSDLEDEMGCDEDDEEEEEELVLMMRSEENRVAHGFGGKVMGGMVDEL